VQLSYDKYGSHVVQKCLESREFSSRRIIAELLSDIDSLLVDPYGDYVIQTAWIVSEVRDKHDDSESFYVDFYQLILWLVFCRIMCDMYCCSI